MRGLAWVGCVLVLAACTRDNGAFDGSGGGGTASTGGDGGTTRTDGVDGVDGPQPVTGSATGTTSGVDGNTVDDAPPLTTGLESTTAGMTTLEPPEGTSSTSTGDLEGGSTSGVMEGGSTTGEIDDPITCCMGESCNNQDIADDCVCNLAPACCMPGGWDLYCTAVAVLNCDLPCIEPPGECCMPNDLSPGCGSFGIMSCVCSNAGNSDCCSVAWTESCVMYAVTNCDLMCG
jgi:hypothetical protein